MSGEINESEDPPSIKAETYWVGCWKRLSLTCAFNKGSATVVVDKVAYSTEDDTASAKKNWSSLVALIALVPALPGLALEPYFAGLL